MTPGTLVFSHANGFPAGTYRRLFDAWQAAGWRVLALPMFGHDPRFPVTSNWPHLRDELQHFVEQRAPGERVHLVGHSLGGFLSLMLACRQPGRVASVVLLDSPVLTGWRAHSVHMAKLGRFIQRVSPARVSHRRRTQWPSRAAALAHFQAKHAFARWHPAVLADYIDAGMVDDDHPGAEPGAVRLAFTREVETAIYNTLAHHLGTLVRHHPPACPVGFIGGRQSVEVRQVGLAATRAVTRGRVAWLEGSHLFPMERPDETAQAVLAMLAPPGPAVPAPPPGPRRDGPTSRPGTAPAARR
jgi:pimeloyl-ACP methyl ester carboxylesterase